MNLHLIKIYTLKDKWKYHCRSDIQKCNRASGQPNILWLFQKMKDHPTIVQFSSVTQSCPTICDPINRSTPALPVHHQLLESTQTHVHWVSDAIQPSHPLSSAFPPTLNPSQHEEGVNESTLRMRWPKYWCFSFSISPSNEHPGLISFRTHLL